jgi:hypothetical protein
VIRALALVALMTATANAQPVTLDELKAAVAKAESVDAAGLDITVMPHSDVPHLVVFRAKLAHAKGRRGGAFVGVYGNGKLITDSDEAMQAVIAAWRYGATRTVKPERVAAVLGFLEGVRDAAHPILSEADIAALPKDDWKSKVALPKEVTVNGKPGVEYWNRSGQPPLWKTVALVGSDGKLDVTVTPINRIK